MTTFTVSGYKSPGNSFTINGGGAAPAKTDFIVLNGVKQTLAEWIARGILTITGTVSTTSTFYVFANPEMIGQSAG